MIIEVKPGRPTSSGGATLAPLVGERAQLAGHGLLGLKRLDAGAAAHLAVAVGPEIGFFSAKAQDVVVDAVHRLAQDAGRVSARGK